MATKGTAWVVRRSTDLVPSLLAMAFAEWRSADGPDLELSGSAPAGGLASEPGLPVEPGRR